MKNKVNSLTAAKKTEKLIEAVEDQRRKLLNVLGLTQALKVAGAAADGGESIDDLEGALEILQDAIQDVVEGLEPMMLDRAIAAQEEAS